MSTKKPSDTAPRRGLQIFLASEGEPLTETQMPMEGVDESVVAGFEAVAATGADLTQGEVVRCLFREPGDEGLSLCHAWFKSGFILPRHSHNADCLYYIVGGELHLGRKVLKKGDGFFIPADVPYSYQAGPEGVEVLEFRNATQFNILFKNNDASHWERIAKSYADKADCWPEETVPPSERAAR
jgi:quercetin dioxygenase-like cupin family protein